MSSICPPITPTIQDSTGRPFPSPPIWVRELLRGTPSLGRLIKPLTQAAEDDLTVLLTGEYGTGKTHLAHLIQTHSRRKDHLLLIGSCGALATPPTAATARAAGRPRPADPQPGGALRQGVGQGAAVARPRGPGGPEGVPLAGEHPAAAQRRRAGCGGQHGPAAVTGASSLVN